MIVEQLTTIDQPRLNEWFKKAINSKISHQLSLSNWTAEIEIKNSSWEQVILMDSSNKAVTIAKFDRDDHSAFISHWRIGGSSLVTFHHMRKLYDILVMNGIKNVKAVCRETNTKSRKLCENIFGQEWGIEPESTYDFHLQKTVGICHYFSKLSDIVNDERIQRLMK